MMTLYWLFDGNHTEMENFYDNKTDAELLMMTYLKLDSLKSGTNDKLLNKMLG